ncbi:MAG: putative quinol monooxygenase [Acidimicrobiales bacterium]
MIFVVVKQPVRPKYADDFPSLIEEFTNATRAEPGNISFDWYRSADDPNLWLCVEAFRDRESGDAHVASAHFKKAMETMPRLLAAAPEIINVEVPGDSWSQMSELDN